MKVLSGDGYAYAPVFSPLCPDLCWFAEQAFDLNTRRFLPDGAASACVEAKKLRDLLGSLTPFGIEDRTDRYLLRWQADPFDSRFLWSYEHTDPFTLLRYNRTTGKRDVFNTLPQRSMGTEFVMGKAGIWVTNHQELMLLDRQTGKILERAGNPNGVGRSMTLRPWGDDVLVSKEWLYQRATKHYVPFFPLPQDMEGCKSPYKVEFLGELCYSAIYDVGNNLGHFITAPGPVVRRLPFLKDWRDERFDLGVNPPLAWFSFKKRIVALNYVNGDSAVYYGSTGRPVNGDQSGRYLAFATELGISFFDKNTCQFRVINRPYGYEQPRHFICAGEHILLTYEKYWEVVDVSKLDTAFAASTLLEDAEAFEQQLRAIYTAVPDDFYPRYAAVLHLYKTYEARKNPKIDERWQDVLRNLGEILFYASPDSVILRAIADYESGRFVPAFNCDATKAIFRFWADQDELKKALQLLDAPDNRTCFQESEWGEIEITQPIRSLQFSLDSLAAFTLPPDERLYAEGKIWEQFGRQKSIYRYHQDPIRNLKKAYDCFRTLIQQYPQSIWADNAAYDTMTYIDFHSTSPDYDFMIQGDDKKAFATFKQFLRDYPQSDRRPDVLLRIAAAFRRGGIEDNNHDASDEAMAAEYLQIIADEYPDFAEVSTFYKNSRQELDRHYWSETWSCTGKPDKSVYQLQDTIRVTVRMQNKSQSVQILDTAFIQHWYQGLRFHLSEVRDQGCEGLWGDFSLTREKPLVATQPVSIQAGGYYEETFVLGSTILNRINGGGYFPLHSGLTYYFDLEFRHPGMPWLWLSDQTVTPTFQLGRNVAPTFQLGRKKND